MRKLWKGIFATAVMLLLCPLPETASAKVKVKKVTVKSNYGSSVHVAVGKKVKLTAAVKVSPNKTANKKVTYKSSKKKIATVSSSGYVKGIKTGKCKVTVTSKKNKKKKAKITVNVVKKVTSVRIEKPENPLYVGNSVTLKATVNPAAGSYKKVTWSSSDPSVASVSSSGALTARKAGTVTIKATSVEGSKKSGKLTLTILSPDSVNISSVEVLNDNFVRVSLDKSAKLSPDLFMVEGRKYAFGTYIRKFRVERLRAYDDRTFDLTLDPAHTIDRDSFVRVTINALPGNGTKTMETQAIYIRNAQPLDQKWIGVVGETWEKTVDLSSYCCGDISYEVTGTIPGITVKEKDNGLSFGGELTTVIVGTELTVKASDETGRSVVQKIHVAVGNGTTIVGRGEDLTWLAGSETEGRAFASAAGGSGTYRYSADSLPAGIRIDEKTGTLSGKPSAAGEYTVQLTITDQENEKRTCRSTAVIRVAEPRKVTGMVADASGKAVAGAAVACENLSDGTIYTAETDETGAYTVYVCEGSYDIRAVQGERDDSVYNMAVGSGGRQIDFTL